MEEQPWFEFVSKNFKETKIGFDPELLNANSAINRTKYFKNHSIEFLPID